MASSEPPATAGWQRIAGAGFILIAFLFLGYFVAGNLGELRSYAWSVRPGLLLLSILLQVIGLVWGVLVWQLLLRRLGRPIALHRLARIWFLSGLGRYIPGKIWQFVGAAHLGAAAGLPAALTVTSLAVHTGIFLLAAMLAAVYLLPVTLAGEIGGFAIEVLRWSAPLALLLLHPAVVGAALALVRRLTRREIASWTGSWLDAVGLVLLATIGWLIAGAAFHLFVGSLAPLPPATLSASIGMNALAFVAGYLVFFVPAGLGAKEGALAAMLTMYLPPPVAALIAIAARLWTVAAEVLPALLLLPRPAPERAPPREAPEERGGERSPPLP